MFPAPQEEEPEGGLQPEADPVAAEPLEEVRRSRRIQGLQPEIDMRVAMGLAPVREDSVALKTGDMETPDNQKEARISPQAKEWWSAELQEVISLEKNGTFELVDPPAGANILGSKWIYRIKEGPPVIFKGRLVVKGTIKLKL